ncbi:hypothetical protein BaRGS_00000927 [Batillaria attramentaria]|uniref:Uncharacterized protein n=1 Tax=Batillaria attramentaria TaxID=370345 RepID=A0ABD0M8B8_9CAEN
MNKSTFLANQFRNGKPQSSVCQATPARAGEKRQAGPFVTRIYSMFPTPKSADKVTRKVTDSRMRTAPRQQHAEVQAKCKQYVDTDTDPRTGGSHKKYSLCTEG